MVILQLPGLEELLDAETAEPFPFQKTFEEAVDEPFCITHTSGTTGIPKPISWTHGLIGTLDAVRLLPPTEGDHGLAPWTDNWNEGDTIYSSFPMSHVSYSSLPFTLLQPGLAELKSKMNADSFETSGCWHADGHCRACILQATLHLGSA